jgi:hypothetical protein
MTARLVFIDSGKGLWIAVCYMSLHCITHIKQISGAQTSGVLAILALKISSPTNPIFNLYCGAMAFRTELTLV